MCAARVDDVLNETGGQTPFCGSYFIYPISMVGLGVVALFAAANAAVPLASFALVSLVLMIAVRLWGRLSLRGLEVSLECDTLKLFVGDSMSVGARIANHKALPVWVRLEVVRPRVRVGDSGMVVGGGEVGAVSEVFREESGEGVGGEAGLLPFEEISGGWRLRGLRRGVFRLGPAFIHAGDMLGLYKKEKKLPYSWEIVMYPKLVALRNFDVPFRDYFGIHPSKGIIEDPAWYEGTREYSGNRPARAIHWKASARYGKLQEKIFEPTSHQKVFFILEGLGFRHVQDQAGFEKALEVCASLAVRLAETGASFGIAVDCAVKGFPAILPLGRGPEHLGMLLEVLARCEFERGQSIAQLIGSVGVQGAGFVILARSPSESTERFFALPSARRNRILFVFARTAAENGEAGEGGEAREAGAVANQESAAQAQSGPSIAVLDEGARLNLEDEASGKGLRYPAVFFSDIVEAEGVRLDQGGADGLPGGGWS